MAKAPCAHIDLKTGKVYTEEQYKAKLVNELPEILDKLPEFKAKYDAVVESAKKMGISIAPGEKQEKPKEEAKPKVEKPTTEETESDMILKGATDEEIDKKFPRTISAKNAKTDAELEELGLDPIQKQQVKKNKETWNKVKADVDSGRVNAQGIAERINTSEHPVITDEETFALTYEKGKLLNEHDKEFAKLQQAIKDGDNDGQLEAVQELARINDQYEPIAKALKSGGTEVGRALQARTRDISADYHLLEVNRRLKEAAGDNPISKKVQDKINDLVQKNKAAEERLAEHQQKIAELQKSQRIQDEINQQLKVQIAKGGQPRIRGKALMAEGIQDLATALGAIKSAVGDEKAVSISTAVTKIAKGLLDEGLATAENVWEKTKAYIKEKLDRELPDIYKDDVKVESKDATTQLKEKVSEGKSLKDMRSELKKRQRELVADGVKEHEELTKTLTRELNEAAGSEKFDERDVRDVLSGYGEVKKPSQDELDKDIREQNTKMRLASSKEDVILKGEAPLKSGYQHEKPSNEVRELQREVRRIMKENGIEDGRSPEQRWKTSLDAIKTRLTNQIADLTKQLETGIKEPKNTNSVEYDAEAKELATIRDGLQDALEKTFGKDEISDEERVKRAMVSVEKSLKEYQRRFVKGDFSPRETTKTPDTPELNKLREMRDNAKEEYERRKKEAEGKEPKSPERKALDRVEKEIAELEDKIAKGDLSEKERKVTPETPELKEAREKRVQLKENLEKLRTEADPYREERKALDTWRKRKETEISAKKERLAAIKAGIEPEPPKEKVMPRRFEDLKLQEDAKRYKMEIENEIEKQRLANRTKLEKGLDWASRWRRFAVLAGSKVLLKLNAAALWQAGVFTPLRKTIQTGLGKLPFIRDIAANAPTEGNYSIQSVAENYSQFWKKEAYTDVLKTLKTGVSQIDAIDGKQPPIEHHWTDYVGNSHAAIKVIPKRAEYFSSYQSASEWALKNGLDLSSPQVQEMIHDVAYSNAIRNIFQNRNQLTTGYRNLVNGIADRGGVGGKIAKALIFDENLPIVTVPINILNDAASYTLGLAKAITTGYEMKYNPDAKMTKEQYSDSIMRDLGKQAVGLLGIGIAYQMYHHLGGMYNKGEKKKIDSLKEGEIEVGDFKIAPLFLHHPGFYAAQITANIQRLIEAHKHDTAKVGKDPFSLSDAVVKSVGSVIKDIPFVESMTSSERVFRDTHSLVMAAGATYVAGQIPNIFEEIAKAMDSKEKRKPTTVLEQVEAKIPVLRENVPEAKMSQSEARTKATDYLYEHKDKGWEDVPQEIKDIANIGDADHRRAFIKNAHLDPEIRQFKKLKVSERKALYAKMNDKDKEKFAPYVDPSAHRGKGKPDPDEVGAKSSGVGEEETPGAESSGVGNESSGVGQENP